VAVLVCILAAGACFADETSDVFNLLDGGLMTSGTGGEIFFTLNANGTVNAGLYTFAGSGDILAFGFDSPGSTPLAESNFQSVTPISEGGLPDMYGYGAAGSGFACPSTPTGCGTGETWTIGTPGEFTSVFQAVTPGNSSFVMETQFGWWAADPDPLPEPSSVLPVGVILGLAALVLRRKRTA
jgi:hypothetical protein